MLRNLLALLGLLAIGAAAAVGLQAYGYWDDDDDGPPPRLAVSYVGLDLSTAEGVELLDRRVRVAVDRICSDDFTRDLKHAASIARCRRRAFASAEPQIRAAITEAGKRAAYADAGLGRPRAAAASSWLPPAAYDAIDRATLRAFETGRYAKWRGGGERGYVVISEERRIGGLWCRNVRTEVRDHGRDVVIGQGARCLTPDGALTNALP